MDRLGDRRVGEGVALVGQLGDQRVEGPAARRRDRRAGRAGTLDQPPAVDQARRRGVVARPPADRARRAQLVEEVVIPPVVEPPLGVVPEHLVDGLAGPQRGHAAQRGARAPG